MRAAGDRASRLGSHFHAELAEVIVERNRAPNIEFVYDDFAGTVGEAPVGGGTLLEEDPRTVDLIGSQDVQFDNVLFEQEVARFECASQFATGNEKRQCFVDAIVSGEEALFSRLKTRPHARVIRIVWEEVGERRAGVDDFDFDQGFPYRILSWSAPLNGSCSPSRGSAAIRSIASTIRRRSCSESFSRSGVDAAQTVTVTSAPSGREAPGSGTTTPFCTRPRMVIRVLWAGSLRSSMGPRSCDRGRGRAMKEVIAACRTRNGKARAGRARPGRTQWGLGLSTEEGGRAAAFCPASYPASIRPSNPRIAGDITRWYSGSRWMSIALRATHNNSNVIGVRSEHAITGATRHPVQHTRSIRVMAFVRTSFFDDTFRVLTENGPFPWQEELFRRFKAGERVTACDIPTGLGKTAVMAIWLLARVAGAKLPRRLVYVVDRRAVVDQATDVALQLREFIADDASAELRERLGLTGKSLPVSTLRGQFVDNREWLEDPSVPAIIVGTVDMIGSRFLFEGYGVSRKMRPYHAGLLGADAMVVLDEAHLVPPFELMLQSVASNQATFGAAAEVASLIPPFQLISLSATGRSQHSDAVCLTDDDLEHPEVKKRLDASKRLSLQDIDDSKSLPEKLANEAWSLAERGQACVRIIVFSNSRDDAEKAKKAIEKLAKGDKKKGIAEVPIKAQLFVGARRVREREDAANWLKTHGFLASGKATPDRPLFVFATSAGEVGVDLDADHMVCDLVAWERMVQRLGRVNRRGDGDARVVVLAETPLADKRTQAALGKPREARTRGEQTAVAKFEATLEEADRLRRAVEVLPDAGEFKDGSPGAIRKVKCDAESDGDLAAILKAATTPPPMRPALTRPVVDAWSMTSLEKHTGRPLVAPWLRGWIEDQPQTSLTWRRYLPLRDGQPPATSEMEAFFEAAPLHLSETLETRTDHVLAWAAKRATAILKAGSTETADVADASSEADAICRETIVAVLLGRALDIIDTLRLGDFIFGSRGKRGKASLERQLQGATMVLDCRFAGLSKDGLLEMDTKQANGRPCTADAEGAWLGDEGLDERLHPPVTGFRVRESDDSATSDDTHWKECFRFATHAAADDEPEHFLVVDKWKHAGTSEESRSAGSLQELETHQTWVAKKARRLASRLGLPPDYERMLSVVARLHDEGKRAVRWQRAFNAPGDVAYAKTPGPVRFSMLDGYRHEFGALPALERDREFNRLDDELKELARHLLVAHHGFARPVIRLAGCADAPPSALEDRARDVALRFARLQKRWGPWGLAWWETLLRAADHQASRDNELHSDSDELEGNNG